MNAPTVHAQPRLSRSERRFAVVMIAPAAGFLGLLVGWPLVRLLVDSLYDIAPLQRIRNYIGFANYREALGMPEFRRAAMRTIGYTAIVVTAEFAMGLAAALLFNSLGQRARIFRTLFLYPLMIAPLVAGLLWRYLLIANFGALNEILSKLGIIGSRNSIGWLSDPSAARFSVSLPALWLTTSFMTLVLFAGLQNVPPEMLEAARLDGAGPVSILVHVVLPTLRPVIAVALVVRGIDAVRAFDVIVIQTNGGPQGAP